MNMKVRKQIYIAPELEAALKRLSQETGETEAEIIQQAIAQKIGAEAEVLALPHTRSWEQARQFIQALMQENPAIGKRTWSRDELYDRNVLRGY